MLIPRILIDGIGDIASNVIWSQTEINTAAQGEASLSTLILRDFDISPYAFVTGKRVIMDFGSDETRFFGGYLWKAGRRHWFPVDDPTHIQRQWRIQLVDNNILFTRRVVFKKDDPAHVGGPMYGPGRLSSPCDESAGIVYDDTVIAELVTNWLDLSVDGIDVSTLVHEVASITYGQVTEPWNAGMTFGDAMKIIAQLPAAIFYLNQWWQLIYADVDVATAPFDLSDRPEGSGGGIPTLVWSDRFDRVVARGLGNGYTWSNDDSYTSDPTTENVHVDGTAAILPSAPDGRPDLPGYNYESFRGIPSPVSGIVRFDFWVPSLANQGPYHPAIGITLSETVACYVLPIDTAGAWSIQAGTYDQSLSAAFTPATSSWYTAEMIYNAAGNIELRVWPQGGSRPSSPDAGPGPIGHTAFYDGAPYIDLYYATLNGEDTKFTNLLIWDTSSVVSADAGSKGYREMTIWDDGSQLANDALGWGAGKGVDHMVFDHEKDVASVAEHGLWQDGFTLWNVWCQPTINKYVHTDLYGSPSSLRGRKDEVQSVELVTHAQGLYPGQVVRFRNHEYGVDINIPVRSSKITFDAPGVPKYTLKLAHVLDKYGFQDPMPKFPSGGGPGSGGPGGGGGPSPGLPGPTTPGGCTDAICGITDTFTRTVADGWGPSDYGAMWAATLGTDAASSVDADHAVLHVPGSSGGGAQEDLTIPVPDEFDLTFDVWHQTVSTSDPSGPNWALLVTTQLYYEFHVNVTGGVTPSMYIQVNGVAYSQVDGFTLNEHTWYTVRLKRDSTTLYVKFWPFGTSEPGSWTTTCSAVSPYAFTGAPRTAQFAIWDADSDAEIWFRNLDISGVNRCTEYASGAGLFDNFNRVGDALAASTSTGYAWWMSSGASSSWAGFAECDGQVFYVTEGMNFNDGVTQRGDGTDPWDHDVFTMRTRFNITETPTSSSPYVGGTLILDLSVVGLVVVMDDREWDPSSGVGGHIEVGGGGFSMPGTHVFAKNDWIANTWYIAELLWDTVNGRVKIRVHEDGTPTPDWQIDTPGAGVRLGVSHPIDFRLLLDTASSLTAYRVQVDYIDFDYAEKPCYDGGPPPAVTGPPLSGPYCETITATSDTLTTSTHYLPGSTRVSVDGVFMRPGTYDQVISGDRDYCELDPAPGELNSRILFGTSRTRTVFICYTINMLYELA